MAAHSVVDKSVLDFIESIYTSQPVDAAFQIGWERLLSVEVNPADYTNLGNAAIIDTVHADTDLETDDAELDYLYLAASQQYEESSRGVESTENSPVDTDYAKDAELDQLC